MLNTSGILQKIGYKTFHVICSDDLNRYLRSLFHLSTNKTQKLLPPMNGSHITVNYGVDEELKSESGILIYFSILLDVYTNGNAYWCPVISQQLEKIRLNSGLSAQNSLGLHYCIGYLKEGKNETLTDKNC